MKYNFYFINEPVSSSINTYLRRGLHGNAFCNRICISTCICISICIRISICICICFWCSHTCTCSLYLQINSSHQRVGWLCVGGIVRLCVCVCGGQVTNDLIVFPRAVFLASGIVPHTFHFPYLRPASGISGAQKEAWQVDLTLGRRRNEVENKHVPLSLLILIIEKCLF